MHPKNICIGDFTYELPSDKIAAFPLVERDTSKLLVYQNNEIKQSVYKNIAEFISPDSLLIFNNTKVIPARILFKKETGGVIEIFCLEPYAVNSYEKAMSSKSTATWKCIIGGAAKWKSGSLKKSINGIELEVTLKEKLSDAFVAVFSWTPSNISFSEMILLFGDMPLPPYIKRKPVEDDKERYQTVYAEFEGSVAAPTAGLHFTQDIFNSLKDKNIYSEYVTLHVGAGTFKPVKTATLHQHEMHSEWIDVSKQTIESIINRNNGNIIAVGTTSLRTIESLYWIGLKVLLNPAITLNELSITQWEVYELPIEKTIINAATSLQALLSWMQKNNLNNIVTSTQILIAPHYKFRIAKAIITNFHQPKSTLLLLIAAALGNNWKNVYQYAFENDFRFLSYGDGSLLYINEENIFKAE